MNSIIQKIQLGRSLIIGIIVIVASWLLVFLIVTVYAVYLSIIAMGEPDRQLIGNFSTTIGPYLRPMSIIIFCYFGTKFIKIQPTFRKINLNVLLGIIVVLLAIPIDVYYSGNLILNHFIWYILIIFSAWLGGKGKNKKQ